MTAARCPVCDNPIDPRGADHFDCEWCLSPLAVLDGEVVRDEMLQPEHVKELTA
jgi:hypothetical protein